MFQAYASDFATHILSLNSLNWMLLAFFIWLVIAWIVLRNNKPAEIAGKSGKPNKSSGENLNSFQLKAHAGLSINELLEIEESLMALKELYVNKFIPSDVFVSESMVWAKKLEGKS